MTRSLIVLIILAVARGSAWFVMLCPETISQKTLTEDFEAHRQAYENFAYHLKKKQITTKITDIPIAEKIRWHQV